MAAANYVHTAVTTNQATTSAAYSTIPGATITAAALSAAGISAGDKVLLLVQAQAAETSSGVINLRVTHGSTPTAFAESVANLAMANQNWRATYWWGTVWTVAASEDIALQFAVTAGTGNVNFVSMFALDLSNDLIEGTHWHADFTSSAATTDVSLSTTPDDGASITFTPTAGHDWLVMTFAQYDSTSSTENFKSSIIRSGEASSSLPSGTLTVSSTPINPIIPLARVFEDLGAVSQTFKEQSVASATANTRLNSGIFALDLDAFAAHANAYTEANEDLQAVTDYADLIQTTTITPTVTGPVYTAGWFNFDYNNNGNQAEFRLQIDNADDPAGQTTANYPYFGPTIQAADEIPLGIQTVTSLSNAAHTLDLDGSVDATTSTPVAKYRSLWSFALELAAVAGGGGAAASGIYRIRRNSWR